MKNELSPNVRGGLDEAREKKPIITCVCGPPCFYCRLAPERYECALEELCQYQRPLRVSPSPDVLEDN